MLATAIPVTADDPPPLSQGHEYYWVVHDDEDPVLKGAGQEWEWLNNLGLQHELHWGIHDEIWYTDLDDPPYYGIRPIRNNSPIWHQNTWIRTRITIDDPDPGDVILHVKIYSPNNIYPEFFNWTVGSGNEENAYFRIRAYDWDTSEELCNYTHAIIDSSSESKDKLDAWIDQFRFELDYYESEFYEH